MLYKVVVLSIFALGAYAKPQSLDDFNAEVESELGPFNVSLSK